MKDNFTQPTRPPSASPLPENALGRRLPRELREDFMRLSSEEAWEEMLFSLTVTLTMFAGIWLLIEVGMQIH